MADLNATFTADFSSFTQACAGAQVSLKKFEDDAAKVGGQLNKMSDSLSGVRIAQQAAIAAEAIDRLGGVSILSQKELAKFGGIATEASEKLRAMGKDVPANIQAIADAAKSARDQTKTLGEQFKDAIPTASSLGAQIKATALGYVTGTLALEGFMKAGTAVIGFMKESIGEAIEADKVQRKLNAALLAQGTAVPAVLEQFDELAAKYQSTTVYSDDLIKSTATMLVQVGNVMPAQMDAALRATTDLAAGLGTDLTQASMLVSKAFEDNFSALKKAGVQIDATRAQAEGMEYVLGQIERRFGGQALADAASYEGQIRQLENAYKDLQETIGKAAIETGALQFVVALMRAEITKTQGEVDAIVDALRRLPEAAAAAGRLDLLGVIRALGKDGKETNAVLAQTNAIIGSYFAATKNAAAGTVGYVQQLADAKAAIAGLTAEQRNELTAAVDLNTKAEEITKRFGLSAGAQDVFKKSLQESRKAAEELKTSLDKLARSTDFIGPLWTKAQMLPEANRDAKEFFDTVREGNVSYGLSLNNLGLANQGTKGLFETLKAFEAAGLGDPPWLEYGPSLNQLYRGTEDWRESLQKLTQDLAALAQIGGEGFGEMVRGIGTVIGSVQAAEHAVEALNGLVMRAQGQGGLGLSPRQREAAQAAIVGYTAGSTLVGATGTRNRALGAAEGAGAGALAGAAFAGPTLGISIGVGAIAGAIGGYLQAKKAADAMRDANNEATKAIGDMQKQLLSQYGPMTEIKRLGDQVGVSLAEAWGSQSQEGLKWFQQLTTEFQTKLAALNEAVQEFGLTWADLAGDKQLEALNTEAEKLATKFKVLERAGYDMGKVTEKSAASLLAMLGEIADAGAAIPPALDPAIRRLGQMSTISDTNAAALNEYLATAIASGTKIPASLEPVIRKLIEMGKLTEDNARAMLGLADVTGPTFAEVSDAAGRYGIELEKLGGKVMQLQITEQAKQAAADWKTLTAAGADLGALMEGMQPKVQAIVTDALKFGAQLPESMRPMLEAMVQAGELTDASGEKLTDLTKLNFAADLNTKIEDLIGTLKDFIETIVNDVVPTITDIGRTQIPPLKIPVVYDYGGPSPYPGGDQSTATGLAAGGLITPNMVQYFARGFVNPWRPMGTDTVPAMLTPGERVLSVADTRRYDAGGTYRPPGSSAFSSGPLIVQTVLDGRVVAESVVRRFPDAVHRYRVG